MSNDLTETDRLEVIAPEERVQDVDLSEQMQSSFLEYAYSVIYSRALPDARDGLKPVQRRILYTMNQMGLWPSRGHVKSARVTGEVMGKLHPHGDASIYDAMVRMSQDFSLRLPLIDGHGNFGSLDDGPAASRYTEARLAEAALAMVEDITEEVVDFVPNYDNQLEQPAVLPAAIPNLLVNGASGIAVGMATNIPPHNLDEVSRAAVHLLKNPSANLEEIMRILPGPDLPTGGIVIGLSGLKDAYATGRGSFRMRARVAVDYPTPKRTELIVSELPYMVGSERVIERIKIGVNAKRITAISSVNDLSDRRNGLRLVIGIKTGFTPEEALAQLYKHTPLEETFGFNSVALVQGKPQTLGLVELLRVFINHRLEIVTRRSIFQLETRRRQLHLVEGLLIAILDVDRVIALIRQSDDAVEAKLRLREEFSLSGDQAEHILQLRLRRLTRLSALELENEKANLDEQIARLSDLLASSSRLEEAVALEIMAWSNKLSTPRRTELRDGQDLEVGKKTTSFDYPCQAYLSSQGFLLAVKSETALPLQDASRAIRGDALKSKTRVRIKDRLGLITSLGRLLPFPATSLPQAPPSDPQAKLGFLARQFLDLASNEKPLALTPLEGDEVIVLGTKRGLIKRVSHGPWPDKTEIGLINLAPGDEVAGADLAPGDEEVIFITQKAQLLRFCAKLVNPKGRQAGGMAGIELGEGDRVIFFGARSRKPGLLVLTVSGQGAEQRSKLSALEDFPRKGRGRAGVRCQNLPPSESLTLAWVGTRPIGVSPGGSPVEINPELIRRDGRGRPQSPPLIGVGDPL